MRVWAPPGAGPGRELTPKTFQGTISIDPGSFFHGFYKDLGWILNQFSMIFRFFLDLIPYAHSAGPGMIRKRLEELFGDRFGDAGKMHRKRSNEHTTQNQTIHRAIFLSSLAPRNARKRLNPPPPLVGDHGVSDHNPRSSKFLSPIPCQILMPNSYAKFFRS